jgi:hypothetical protein
MIKKEEKNSEELNDLIDLFLKVVSILLMSASATGVIIELIKYFF